MCGRSKDCRDLPGLLTGLGELGLCPSESMIAAAISAYGRSGQCQESLQLLETMHERIGLKPGPGCFTAAIGCCSSHEGHCERALALLGEMRRQRMPVTEITYVAAISACGKSQQCERALELLEEMHTAGNLPRSARTYNAVIAACCKSKQFAKGRQVLELMEADGVPPNTESYTTLISAARKAGLWHDAAKLGRNSGKSGLVLFFLLTTWFFYFC